MSQGRAESNRDSISLRRRPGLQRIAPKKETEKLKDTEKPKEKDKDGEKEKGDQSHESPPASGGRGIRTRLSTGSIHMNGTYTIAVAKEIENNQSLMHKETSTMPSPSTAATPASGSGRKRGSVEGIHAQGPGGQTIPPKRRKIGRNDGSGEDNRNDYFCWLCHKEGTVICCELCPRVYHTKCLNLGQKLPKDWVCPECEKIMRAECIDTRSKAMSMISIDTLCTLLKYALERMTHQGSDPFMKPVDLSAVPYYTDYVYNAMDLGQLERNIKKKLYGCTEAFLADAKWILHNCIIFNGTHHKLTSSAKMIIKICKHEMNEIELCPDCYWNSCVRKNDEWFSETCRTPHTLVWAKLKGYPFWPAKALREEDDQVDVRFFGAHDRSWVPTSQVYMLSKDIPTPAKNKRGGFENAMEELEIHIQKIREKFGHFEYASFRMPYDKNHVYFHNKMKQPFRKGRQAANSAKLAFSPKPKLYTVKHVHPGKVTSDSPTKAERQSVMLKTADAVRSKYNSMITTRRVTADTPLNRTDTSSKTDGSVGQTNRAPVKVVPTSLIKVVKVPGPIILKQGDIERRVIIQTPSENQAKVSIVDKVQDKIKQMNADCPDDEAEEAVKTHLVLQSSVSLKSSDDCEDSVTKIDPDQIDSSQGPVISEDIVEEKTNTDASSDHDIKMEAEDSDADISHEGSGSPSKKIYLENLQKTIQSCKEKLGLSDDSILSADDMDEDDDEDEENQDHKDDEEKEDVCNENGNANVAMESDVSSEENKSVTLSTSSDDNSTKEKSDEKTDTKVVSSSVKVEGSPQTDLEQKVETEKKQTDTDSEKSVNETTAIEKEERTDGTKEQKVTRTDDEKIDRTKNSNNEQGNDLSERSNDDIRKDQIDDSTDKQENVVTERATQDRMENINEGQKDKQSSPEKILHDSDKSESSLIVLEQTSDSKSEDSSSKDTNVSKLSALVSDKMDADEPNLVMEVETDSDTDQLVMDLDNEYQTTLSPKSQTLTPTKQRENVSLLPPKVKVTSGASDKVKKIDLSGVNKIVVVKQSSSTGENPLKSPTILKSPPGSIVKSPTAKSPPGSVIKSPTARPPNSRKSPVVCKRVPSAEFFQSAVEKTMKSPNSSMEKSMEVESESMLESSSNPESDAPAHSEIISKFTKKLMGSIQGTFEMMCSEFISQELQPKNVTKDLQAEIQKLRWEQHQQIVELKHNFQLTMAEMKTCWEAEKQRIVSEVNSLNSKDKEKAINETKKKQWCASCGKEAIFYCCWNTSYCDYPCQQAHWPKHMPTCMQTQQAQASANEKEAGDKDSQSTVAASPSVKAPTQDQDRAVETSAAGSIPVTGSLVSSAQVTANTPVLGSGESPIDVEMERPRPQLWDQTNVQPLRQDISPYMCAPPLPPQGAAVQVPQGGLQFTPVVPSPGVVSPMNQDQLKKKVNCHGWSEQTMAEAYNAVMTGGMSVNKAAKVFQVPRIRLADRIAAIGKAAQYPSSNGGPQIPQGTSNPQMLSGSSNIVSSQPILQYVQSPQPIISLPQSSLPVQQFTQMGMQTVQVQGQPTPTGLVQNQQAIVQNRSLVQPNSSVLFPMNVAGGVMPGNLVFSQSGPRPYQLPPRPY